MREGSHSGSQAVGTGHSDQVRARYDPQGYVILQRQTVGLTVRKVRLGVLYRNCALCKIAGDHAAA